MASSLICSFFSRNKVNNLVSLKLRNTITEHYYYYYFDSYVHKIYVSYL